MADGGVCAGVFDAGRIGARAGAAGLHGYTQRHCLHVNSYPNGINVDATNLVNGFSTGINLQLQSGVKVDIPTGAGGVNAVNAANSTGVSPGSADITINVIDNVTINNAANPLRADPGSC